MNRRELLALGTASLLAGWPTRTSAQPNPTEAREVRPRRFGLGIVTYNIAADWDLATILRVCKTVGLQAVELRTTHKHGVEPHLSKSGRRDIRHRFADSGVVLWGLGTVCEFHGPDDLTITKNIRLCEQFLELSADVGAKGVKVRPNALVPGVPASETLERISKALAQCGKAAADLGQEIWLEVHGPGTSHPPHIHTIMLACNLPNVGVTWNSNMTDLKDGSVRPYFDLLRPWIKSVHINELHSAYPWRELFTCLKEMGYDRYTLAEIPGAPNVASGERLLRYYKALWEQLSS